MNEVPGRVAAALLLLFLLAVVGGSALGYGLSQVQTASDQALRALCSLRQGYIQQENDTRRYLATHPDGAPALGLTRADLERTIASLKARAASLSDVECR